MPQNVPNGINAVINGDKIQTVPQDTASIDGFGRLRTSQPFAIFDHKQTADDLDIANSVENFPLFFDNQETSGTGTTTTFDVNRASTTLGVSDTTSGTRVRQSKQRFNYQPAKSHLIVSTGIFGAQNTGITKRMGYFDENNGWFYETDGTDFSVVRRANVTGSPVDDKVIQSDWNIDTMDGSGPSGLTVDITKMQIFVIDFQWLGAGRIRMCLDIDGRMHPVHQFLISNVLAEVSVSTPNLPMRAEINNDGSGIVDTLEIVCSSIIIEGQLEANGINRTHDNGIIHVDADAIGAFYAILGIKLRPTHLGISVLLHDVNVFAKTNDSFYWAVSFNPTIAGTFTYSNIDKSSLEGAVGSTANTVSDLGIIINSGYGQAKTSLVEDIDSALKLGSLIDGTPDELVLIVSPFSNNLDILGSIGYKELI